MSNVTTNQTILTNLKEKESVHKHDFQNSKRPHTVNKSQKTAGYHNFGNR